MLVVIGLIALLIGILLPAAARVRDAARSTQCLSNLRQIGLAISAYANDHEGCLVPGDYVGRIDGFDDDGAGSWADILVDADYLRVPTGEYPADRLYADFPDALSRTSTVLRCPAGTDENASIDYPTSQADARGSFYFVRGSDVTHGAVFTWYAINCAPHLEADSSGRSLPFNFLPDYSNGIADWRITRLAKLKPPVPLVFDGVWCFNNDPARINARHDDRRSTNVLYADGHAEARRTAELPNADWYLR